MKNWGKNEFLKKLKEMKKIIFKLLNFFPNNFCEFLIFQNFYS